MSILRDIASPGFWGGKVLPRPGQKIYNFRLGEACYLGNLEAAFFL